MISEKGWDFLKDSYTQLILVEDQNWITLSGLDWNAEWVKDTVKNL